MTEILETEPVLDVRSLCGVSPTGRTLIEDVRFSVGRSECLAIVGESGAGKTLSVRAALGLQAETIRVSGYVRWRGDASARPAGGAAAREVLGRRAVYLIQQPMGAFDPLVRIGVQIRETLRSEKGVRGAEADEKARAALKALRFDDPDRVLRSFPCELSGGMLQRCMIALVMLLEPELVVADESTSALDVLASREVIGELRRLREQKGLAMILITHDLAAARALADRFVVMRSGRVVESGGREVIESPQDPFTQRLVGTRRRTEAALARAMSGEEGSGASAASGTAPAVEPGPFLSVRGISKSWRTGFLFGRRGRAVLRDVSFSIRSGEVVGLVGLSGEGKSTLSRILLGLDPADAGSVEIEGLSFTEWRRRNPGGMSVVFQNYADSVNAEWTVREIVEEPLRILGRGAASGEVESLLERTGLPAAKADASPTGLSGGELQRVAIARALISRPRFVIFDEAVSSLDATVQAEVLELLSSLHSPQSAWLFISHDIDALATLCPRILFLNGGRIVSDLRRERLAQASDPHVREILEAAAGQ